MDIIHSEVQLSITVPTLPLSTINVMDYLKGEISYAEGPKSRHLVARVPLKDWIENSHEIIMRFHSKLMFHGTMHTDWNRFQSVMLRSVREHEQPSSLPIHVDYYDYIFTCVIVEPPNIPEV